ncbi:MAG TPA: stage II sporulation protein D [Candidatus Acidoferrum sp.]|nr:stage II sporulation protein D [Candidatus Acidoferrum sp.]
MCRRLINWVAGALAAGLLLPLIVLVVVSPPKEEQTEPVMGGQTENMILVYYTKEDRVAAVDIEEHLVGVLAGEIPASFSPEAIKAQAVAARSYIMYKKGTASHKGGADVCTDYRHCKTWLSAGEIQELYGDKALEATAIFRSAVEATKGEVLVYGEKVALAVFHAMSGGGATESAAEVWGGDYPYLVSVPTNDEGFEGYETTVTFGVEEFWEIAASVGATPEGGSPYTVVSRSTGGGVAQCTIGGVALTGVQVRALYGLRSAGFIVKVTDTAVTFTVEGSGHGVGMSQCGAENMARDGSSYADILAHYYPGCTRTYISDIQGQD